MSDGHPKEDEKSESQAHPHPDTNHQLALTQLGLHRDLLLDELELGLLERLHGLVDSGAGALLVDGNHCHHVGFTSVKIF